MGRRVVFVPKLNFHSYGGETPSIKSFIFGWSIPGIKSRLMVSATKHYRNHWFLSTYYTHMPSKNKCELLTKIKIDLCITLHFIVLLSEHFFTYWNPEKFPQGWPPHKIMVKSHLWHLVDYKTATPPVNTRFVTVLLLYWYVLYFCFCAFFRFCFFYDVPHGWFWNKFIIRPKAENIVQSIC